MPPSRRLLLALIAAGALLPHPPSASAQFFFPFSDDPPRRGQYAEPRPLFNDPAARPAQRARPARSRDAYLNEYLYENEPLAEPLPGARRKKGATRIVALPPDADPDYSTPVDLDGEVDPRMSRRRIVPDPTGEPAGTLTINTGLRKLYLSLGDGQAVEYAVGVGRQGFTWKGMAQIGRKAFWPGWTPPPEMLERRPELPDHMDGSLDNPLGARALYLFQGKKDTLFRIHGTNEPHTIGRAVSSGCIRMLNADVIDLYRRVTKGARVVVL